MFLKELMLYDVVLCWGMTQEGSNSLFLWLLKIFKIAQISDVTCFFKLNNFIVFYIGTFMMPQAVLKMFCYRNDIDNVQVMKY